MVFSICLGGRVMYSLYLPIKYGHILFVICSFVLFNLRFWLKRRNPNATLALPLRILPHINDTLMLLTGVSLMLIGSWSPFAATWLGMKLLLVVVYIVLGIVAQKNIHTSKGFIFYSLSLLAFFAMVLLSLCKIG